MNVERLIEVAERHVSDAAAKAALWLPDLLAAAAILAVGWTLALGLAWLTRRVVARMVRWLPGGRVRAAVQAAVNENRTADFVSRVVFWLAVVVAFMAATEALGLPVLSAWLGGVLSYAPRLLVAALIVVVGLVAGHVADAAAARAAAAAGSAVPERMGKLAWAAIVGISLLVAADQIGVEIAFLTTALLITLAALLGGASLAFSLGARTTIANVIAAHYVRRTYDVGQRLRIDGVEGKLLQVLPTAVVLETREGQVAIPADTFAHQHSVLVSGEAAS